MDEERVDCAAGNQRRSVGRVPSEERASKVGLGDDRDLGSDRIGVAVERDSRRGSVHGLLREADRVVLDLGLQKPRSAGDADGASVGALVEVRHDVVLRRRLEIAERRHRSVLPPVRHLDDAVLPVGRVEVREHAFNSVLSKDSAAVLLDRCVASEVGVERTVVLRDELCAVDYALRDLRVLVDARRGIVVVKDFLRVMTAVVAADIPVHTLRAIHVKFAIYAVVQRVRHVVIARQVVFKRRDVGVA